MVTVRFSPSQLKALTAQFSGDENDDDDEGDAGDENDSLNPASKKDFARDVFAALQNLKHIGKFEAILFQDVNKLDVDSDALDSALTLLKHVATGITESRNRLPWSSARVARSFAVLTGSAEVQVRRARALGFIREAVETMPKHDPNLDKEVPPLGDAFIALLESGATVRFVLSAAGEAERLIGRLRELDPAFSRLDPAHVLGALRRTKPSKTVTKGGAGLMAPPLLAARLSTKVGAFGDTDVTKAKKRFLEAERVAKEDL